MEVSTPIQHEYPTIAPKNSSDYDPSSTVRGSFPDGLATVVVSKAATITLTAIALITSEGTAETLAPTEAPLLSSESTNIDLSAGQIAGVVLGAITSLMLLVLMFYLLLTRARWVGRLDLWRLEVREKYRYRSKRPPRRATRSSVNTRWIGDGRQTRLNRMAKRPLASIPTSSRWKQPGSNERASRQSAGKRGHRVGHRH